jgi:Zn-dependent protease
MMNDFTVEIERVRGIVGKYFPIYDVRVSYEAVSLFCKIDEYTLEEKFDELRKELLSLNYIPILTQETGEYIIHVTKKMKVRYKSSSVNIVLLIATISTTIFAGAVQWASYIGLGELGDILSSSTLFFGTIFFALPLMVILGVHELGHYFMSKRHKVAASLPFFIPAPPPLLLGTMGAFISLREPIPNRKALMDIGVAGPIAGLLIAIPVTIIGLILTATGQQPVPQNPGDAGVLYIGTPVIYMLLSYLVPTPENVLIHPTAFAGWVGFLVTAINLLPAGQLDGGHIFYAKLCCNYLHDSFEFHVYGLVSFCTSHNNLRDKTSSTA